MDTILAFAPNAIKMTSPGAYESNQQLAVIRRQLGELARHVNATGCIDGLDGEQIRATIDAHLRTVAKLLRRNLDRWSR